MAECSVCKKNVAAYFLRGSSSSICKDCRILIGKRTCTECKEEKRFSEFYWSEKDKDYRAICIPCFAKQNRDAYAKNPKSIHKRHRRNELLKKYNLTEAEFEEMRARQANRCAICKLEKTLEIDHKHLTGKVRELLCGSCNRGIGLLRENPIILREAAEYCERHEVKSEGQNLGHDVDATPLLS